MSIKKLASETAWYGMSSIVGRFLNVLLVPIYTRLLNPSEYGVVTEMYAYTAFLIVIFSYRMETAFFRFGTPLPDRTTAYATGVKSIFASTILFAGLLLAFATPIASALRYPEHSHYIRWFALILAFDALSELPFARLRLENRPRKFAFTKLFNIVINITFNLFWLVFCPWASEKGYNWVHWVWSPGLGVAYIFLSTLVASAATLFVLLPELRGAMQSNFDKILWKKMLRYSAPLVIVGFAGIVDEMLSRASMKYLLTGTSEENDAQLGIFGANYKFAMLIALFTQAYRYAAEPFFFKNAAAGDALETQAAATKWYTIAASTGMVAILCFLDWIKYFLGSAFHEGLHIVPILMLANILLGIYYNFSVWYRLKDKTMTGAWISVASAVLTVLLIFWWVPKFGYIGAAWASFCCYLFLSIATYFTGKKYYPVNYPIGMMVFYVLLALGMGLLSRWIGAGWSGYLWVLFLINLLIFSSFCGVVFFIEKRNLHLKGSQ